MPEGLAFGPDGLLPVVVQDRASGDVLMVAFANAEALARTAETGFAHFWSRRRQALWLKGETSGNRLRIRALLADCDRDALLMVAEPEGPACHAGTRTCFGDATPTAAGVLDELRRVIDERRQRGGEGSYTAKLFAKGLDHTLKKLGEEATEVILAAKGESDERLAEEAADLAYHLLVVLAQRGLAPDRVLDVLRARRR
ncbi:MAG TPA: bifunctional phosphoribosyl-AMP cyclohydrolase/phosphoribosyl-ATP diphosphatase HisIE [Vicinamibacteria bacterium]|nr:bifunctional phosphoribosyl-AMP cyclohydrolase/phosphoribosyl-ATP diphosphatase HisIE [Vicinamibacteria bacterium]